MNAGWGGGRKWQVMVPEGAPAGKESQVVLVVLSRGMEAKELHLRRPPRPSRTVAQSSAPIDIRVPVQAVCIWSCAQMLGEGELFCVTPT